MKLSKDVLKSLDEREIKILRLIKLGWSIKDIANELGLSHLGFKSGYMPGFYKKLGMYSKAEKYAHNRRHKSRELMAALFASDFK